MSTEVFLPVVSSLTNEEAIGVDVMKWSRIPEDGKLWWDYRKDGASGIAKEAIQEVQKVAENTPLSKGARIELAENEKEAKFMLCIPSPDGDTMNRIHIESIPYPKRIDSNFVGMVMEELSSILHIKGQKPFSKADCPIMWIL